MQKKSSKTKDIKVVLQGEDRLIIQLPQPVSDVPAGTSIPVQEVIDYLQAASINAAGACSCAGAFCTCYGRTAALGICVLPKLSKPLRQSGR